MARIPKVIRAAIDRFLGTPPHNKPFFNISDQANKLLELYKRPQENRHHCWRSPYETHFQI